MERIKVIGVGPGGEDYLLPAAKKAAAAADVLVGGRRVLALFADLGKEEVVVDGCLGRVVDFIRKNRGKKIAVLVSGDPGLYSLFDYLLKHFSAEELEVIPGVSSVQLAFARAGLTWQDAVVFSLHGRNGDRVMSEKVLPAVQSRQKVALLADRNYPPQKVAAFLARHGVAGRRMIVGENLSYPDEKIVEGGIPYLACCPKQFVNCVVLIVDE